MKVLGSMFSLDNVVLSKKLIFVDIGAKFNDIVIWTIVVFIIVLAFKNSNEIIIKNKNLQFFSTFILIIFSILHIFYFILSENKVSEFLYFNF